MKILVTGGAGYIGSVVCAKLIEGGHRVISLDNLDSGLEPVLPDGVDFRQGDIREVGAHVKADDGVEAVIHLAGLIQVAESMEHPARYWQTNAAGSLAMFEGLRALGIHNLIFSSTAACYGTPERTPIEETDAPHPESVYGWTKLAVDQVLSSYARAYRWAALSLRYFNVAGAYGRYGERHQPETHIIPLALQAAAANRPFTLFGDDYPTADGTNVRDYLHVADLADAHVLALDKLAKGRHEIVNISTGEGSSNRQVVAAVEKATGQKLAIDVKPRRSGDPAVLVASNAKAQQFLGWKPTHSLDDMVADAWAYMRDSTTV